MFSDEYLNNCIRALNLERLTCNDSETSFIQSFLPAEIGPFWLISEGNLMRLHRFLLNSRHVACQSANFGYRFSPFRPIQTVQFLQNSELSTWHFQGKNSKVKAVDSAATVINEETVNKGLESSPNDVVAVESYDEHLVQKHSENRISFQGEGSSNSLQLSDDTFSENKKTFTLSQEEMSPQLKSQFAEMRRFYTLEINVDRDGNALQNVMIDKMIERLCRFLWFLKNMKNVEPKLVSCSEPQLVEEFVHYMMKVRSIKAITCSRYITAFINVSKVPATTCNENPN